MEKTVVSGRGEGAVGEGTDRAHPGGERTTPGRERIFLALGVVLLGCAVAALGVYVSQRLLTSSTHHLEIIPAYAVAAVVAVCGLTVLVLYCKRIPVVVWVSVGVCLGSAGLCGAGLLLTGLLVVRPLQSLLHCSYLAPTRACHCVSPYLRPSPLQLQYTPQAPTTLVFEDTEGCALVETVLLPTLYVLLAVEAVVLLLAVLCAAIALKAHCVQRSRNRQLQDDAYEEIFTVSNGSTSPSCDSDALGAPGTGTELIFSPRPPLLAPSRTRTEIIRGLAGQPLDPVGGQQGGGGGRALQPGGLPLAANIRRCHSFHQPRGAATEEEEEEEEGNLEEGIYENAEAARALNLPSLALGGSGGRLKEHRRRSRRAVTLHNLDTRQLMLILSLQMRYLQEAESSRSQAKLEPQPPPQQALPRATTPPPGSATRRRGSLEMPSQQPRAASPPTHPSDRQPAPLPLPQGSSSLRQASGEGDGSGHQGGEGAQGPWMGGNQTVPERLGRPLAARRSQTPCEGSAKMSSGRVPQPGSARRSLTPQPGNDATLPLRPVVQSGSHFSQAASPRGAGAVYENVAALQPRHHHHHHHHHQAVASPSQQVLESLRNGQAEAAGSASWSHGGSSSRRETTPPERDVGDGFQRQRGAQAATPARMNHYEEIDDVARDLAADHGQWQPPDRVDRSGVEGQDDSGYPVRDEPLLSSRAEAYRLRDAGSRHPGDVDLGDSGTQHLYAQLPSRDLRRMGCETPSRPKSYMSAVDKSESPHSSQTGLQGNGSQGPEQGELGFQHAGDGSAQAAVALSPSQMQDIYAQPVRKGRAKSLQHQYANRDQVYAGEADAEPVNAQLFTSVVPPSVVNGSASPRLPRNENERSAFTAVGRTDSRQPGHGEGPVDQHGPRRARLDTGDESWSRSPRDGPPDHERSHGDVTFVHSPASGSRLVRNGGFHLESSSPHHSRSSLLSGSSPHHSQHSLLSQASPHHSCDSLTSRSSPRFRGAHPAQPVAHHSSDGLSSRPEAEMGPPSARNPLRGGPPPPPPPPPPPYSPPPAYLEVQSHSQDGSHPSSTSDASDGGGDVYRQVARGGGAQGGRQMLQRHPSGTFPGSRHHLAAAHGDSPRTHVQPRAASQERSPRDHLSYSPGRDPASPREYHTLDVHPGLHHANDRHGRTSPHRRQEAGTVLGPGAKYAPGQNGRMEARRNHLGGQRGGGEGGRRSNHATSYVYQDYSGFEDSQGPSLNIASAGERVHRNGEAWGGSPHQDWPGGGRPGKTVAKPVRPHHYDSLDDVFDPAPPHPGSGHSEVGGPPRGGGRGQRGGREMIHYGHILHLDHAAESDAETTEMETVI